MGWDLPDWSRLATSHSNQGMSWKNDGKKQNIFVFFIVIFIVIPWHALMVGCVLVCCMFHFLIIILSSQMENWQRQLKGVMRLWIMFGPHFFRFIFVLNIRGLREALIVIFTIGLTKFFDLLFEVCFQFIAVRSWVQCRLQNLQSK